MFIVFYLNKEYLQSVIIIINSTVINCKIKKNDITSMKNRNSIMFSTIPLGYYRASDIHNCKFIVVTLKQYICLHPVLYLETTSFMVNNIPDRRRKRNSLILFEMNFMEIYLLLRLLHTTTIIKYITLYIFSDHH